MTTPTLSPRHDALLRLVLAAGEAVQPGALEQALQTSRPTIDRALQDLVASGFLQKLGNDRSTRYMATDAAKAALGSLPSGGTTPAWFASTILAARRQLSWPLEGEEIC